jgi:sterol desaturase/sphingolipid hydroxylase (fatty acid hydroxylase superfamily)
MNVNGSISLADALRYGYAPLMLLGVNGTGLWLLSGGGEGTVVLMLLTAIGLSFAVERVIPYRPNWNRPRGDAGRDIVHAVVNETANLATVASLPLAAATMPAFDVWPSSWPFWLQVAGAVLVLDAGITLAHYASHRFALLWHFHAVHHSVRRMYGLNGLMKHPLHQAIEMAAGATPLLFLGLPHDVALALVLCTGVQLLLQHSNADIRLGPFKYLLATNEVHRFHHLASAGLGDVNFGLFTTIWDQMLGTFHWDPARRFASEDLGVGDRPDYPTEYAAQLLEPFRVP